MGGERASYLSLDVCTDEPRVGKNSVDRVLTKQQEDPPEPVLTIKVAGEVVRELDTERHYITHFKDTLYILKRQKTVVKLVMNWARKCW